MRHIRAAAIACALLVSTTVSPAITEATPLAPAAVVYTAAEDTEASSAGSSSLKLIGAIVGLIGGIASLAVAVIKATPGAEDNIRNLIRG